MRQDTLPTLTLRVCEQWRLFVGPDEVRFRGQRDRALMTLLLLEAPATLARHQIADLLWPDSAKDKARASLRQLISTVKRTLSDHGVATDFLEGAVLGGPFATVRTELDDLVWADTPVARTKSLLGQLSKENAFLPGLEALTPEFDDWLAHTRSALSKGLGERLSRLFGDTTASADLRILAADTALRLNSYDESAVRAKMAALVDHSETAQALKVYADFVDLLDDDLGAEPSLKTQDLAVEIKLTLELPSNAPVAKPVDGTLSGVAIAVLPFVALGPDPVSRYDLWGILDQLTCALAMNQAPAVISSNSTRNYINADARIAKVHADFDVSYVVTGSVRADANEAIVTIQLCDAPTERVVWSWVKTCRRADLVSIHSDIAQEISNAISPSLHAAELSRTVDIAVGDLEPYHMVLRAKDHMFKLTQTDFEAAGTLLEQALQKSAVFAPAHALLADWYSIRYWQRWSEQPATDFQKMNEHVQRAMSLAPRNGRIMAMWGHFKIVLERNYDAAAELFSEAISLNPNDAETLNWSVPTLAYSGHSEVALENSRRAMRLSPYDPFLFRNEHFLSIAHYANGDFDLAAQYGLSSFRRVPTYTSNVRTTIASLVAAGRQDGLDDLLSAHSEAEPGFSLNAFLPNQGFRDADQKQLYGQRLLAAGLPP